MRWLPLPIALACWVAVAVAQPGRDAGVAQPDGRAPAAVEEAAPPATAPPAAPPIDAGIAPAPALRDAAPDASSTSTPDAAPAPAQNAPRPRPARAPIPVDAGVPEAAIDAGGGPEAELAPDGGLEADPASVGDAEAPDLVPSEPEPEPEPELDRGRLSLDPSLVAPPPETHPEAAPPEAAAENTLFAVKIIAGLAVLVVLAYLGGHRRVVRFQERLGISGLMTAGFPFVALGLVASDPSVGILTPDIIDRLQPVLHFGLGWLGFIIGAQLDIRVLDRVPRGTAYLILVEALGPFAITAAACGAVMLSFGMSWEDPSLWRDMIVLGTAAAMTAPRRFRGFANRTWHEGRGVDVLLGQLDELVGVIGLLFITAYFRDPLEATWQLPDTAWVFVSLGLGVAIGVVIFAMVRVPQSNAEFLAVVLGAIAFASGLAGYLQLSPIVVCFLAGVLVTNFPNEQRESIFRILNHLERPVHLLFLIIAGAVWDVTDWRGWALVPLFVFARLAGKYLGIFASKTAVGSLLPAGYADQRQLIAPMSGLSIALVISMGALYSDAGLPWVITAVIGGSIATELLVQRTSREEAKVRDPVDELDDESDAHHDLLHRDDAAPGDKGGPS